MKIPGLIAALLLIAVTATGCARRGVTVRESSDSVARAILLGDANAKADAHVHAIAADTFATAIGTDAHGNGALVASGEAAEAWEAVFAFGPRAGAQPALRCEYRSKRGGQRLGELLRELAVREGELIYVEGEMRFASISPEGGAGNFVVAGVAARAARKVSGERKRLFAAIDVATGSRNEVVEFRAIDADGGTKVVRIDGDSIVESGSFDVYEIGEIDAK